MKKKIKVILTENIRRTGHAGDIIIVAKGYFNNYLNIRKLAIPYTEQTFQEYQNTGGIDEIKLREAENIAKKIQGIYLYFAKLNMIKTNSNEAVLYGSITSKEIADEINKIANVNIDKNCIDMSTKIKTTGIYSMQVILYNGITSKFTIVIASEIEQAKNMLSEFLKNKDTKEVSNV